MQNKKDNSTVAAIEPQLLRARDVARALAVSESQVRNWQRAGVLREIRIPGIRAVRFATSDVERLAAAWTTTERGLVGA